MKHQSIVRYASVVSLTLFLRTYVYFVCTGALSECSLCTIECSSWGQRMASDPVDLECETESYGKAASALNYWAFSMGSLMKRLLKSIYAYFLLEWVFPALPSSGLGSLWTHCERLLGSAFVFRWRVLFMSCVWSHELCRSPHRWPFRTYFAAE